MNNARVSTSFLLVALLLSSVACGPEAPPPPPPNERPEILVVEAPTPVLEGSLLRVTGLRFDRLGPVPTLSVDGDFGGDVLELENEGQPGELFFRVSSTLVDSVGAGSASFDAVLSGNTGSSDPFPFSVTIGSDLPVDLTEAPTGIVHYNEEAIVRGAGFVSPTEGTVTARFEGTFVEDGGASRAVSASLPVLPAERYGRERGIVRLTTALGSVHPGTFDGTMTLDSELTSGARSSSGTEDVSFEFLPPDLFDIAPSTASLEQIVTITGNGFLGGPDEPDEATLVRLAGEFTPMGDAPRSMDEELVLEWLSGEAMQAAIRAEERRNELISELFRARRGVFMGTATVVVIKGTESHSGTPVPFTFTLGPVQQIVYVRFLPGFYTSLPLFGLEASPGVIESLVEARMESIYGDWNVDIRLERPMDFSPNGYTTVEIGGPDPNGRGLFGYDNTPGKDINNVRLFDRIGGTNAETQEDGYPGYGGVFVESMLYFSSHPDVPGAMPARRPDPDPIFDEIFDPVRTGRPATIPEIDGEGDATRVAEVRRALEALASMIGETTAHELGHSFGLAEPFGPSTTFHNAGDGDGCLMDSGGARPVGERTAQPGFAETHLCYSAPGYLDDILGD